MQFPAADARVISAGGFQQNNDGGTPIWNKSPNSFTDCPTFPPGTELPGTECGSDFSVLSDAGQYISGKQELMGSAQSVLSTTYPHFNYEAYAECGDGYPGPGWRGGTGLCTGTSMSAPQISGVVGLLRTINPLVPFGTPTGNAPIGLRYVLAQTTPQSVLHQPWNSEFGYGIPDAAAAAKMVLGKVAGGVVRNRATPLFRLYTAATGGPIDYADTTSPQFALSLLINQVHNYATPPALATPANVVPGYSYPYDIGNEAAPPSAYASIYVLTTEFTPRSIWPELIPLYLMDNPKAAGTEFALFTPVDLEAAHNGGYKNLRTIQGYIYKPCSPEPTCISPYAHKLYRECNSALTDCATVLDSELTAFSALGYHYQFPIGSNALLGYAYNNIDTDHDGLPDGFEEVVGTDPLIFDSNGSVDGSGHLVADSVKFPLAGISTIDPCIGGTLGARNCGGDDIFKYGFEVL